jgi:hypothetical protein
MPLALMRPSSRSAVQGPHGKSNVVTSLASISTSMASFCGITFSLMYGWQKCQERSGIHLLLLSSRRDHMAETLVAPRSDPLFTRIDVKQAVGFGAGGELSLSARALLRRRLQHLANLQIIGIWPARALLSYSQGQSTLNVDLSTIYEGITDRLSNGHEESEPFDSQNIC